MDQILWIDLEMTGLNRQKDSCIEIACIITNKKMEKKASFHKVIYQSDETLKKMDDWNQTHHKKSGLMDEIPKGEKLEKVEKDLITWVKEHFKENEKIHIAGNSIYHDRIFLIKDFPEFESYLHYQMIDVTAWKILLKEIYNIDYQKKNTHRAMDDIEESISEMKHYLSFINIAN